MIGGSFGDLLRRMRMESKITLREFSRRTNQDPGNISRIERGKVPPPQNRNILTTMARTLGLEEQSDNWNNFIYTAQVQAGRIPKEVLSNEEVLQKVPILLRKLGGEKLSPKEIDDLVELIRRD